MQECIPEEKRRSFKISDGVSLFAISRIQNISHPPSDKSTICTISCRLQCSRSLRGHSATRGAFAQGVPMLGRAMVLSAVVAFAERPSWERRRGELEPSGMHRGMHKARDWVLERNLGSKIVIFEVCTEVCTTLGMGSERSNLWSKIVIFEVCTEVCTTLGIGF
jgi:hypothetical protein